MKWSIWYILKIMLFKYHYFKIIIILMPYFVWKRFFKNSIATSIPSIMHLCGDEWANITMPFHVHNYLIKSSFKI